VLVKIERAGLFWSIFDEMIYDAGDMCMYTRPLFDALSTKRFLTTRFDFFSFF
jgi:hypothetical protein